MGKQKGMKDESGLSCQQRLLGTFVWLCSMLINTVCPLFLLNCISNFFLASQSPSCVHLCVSGVLSASNWSETLVRGVRLSMEKHLE